MADYISREAAIEAAKSHYPKANEMIAAIILVPSADVRPVVHGAWKPNPRNPYWLDCTVCGYGKPERMVYNICPNCGADMRDG